jgi:hypothetical protein
MRPLLKRVAERKRLRMITISSSNRRNPFPKTDSEVKMPDNGDDPGSQEETKDVDNDSIIAALETFSEEDSK